MYQTTHTVKDAELAKLQMDVVASTLIISYHSPLFHFTTTILMS